MLRNVLFAAFVLSFALVLPAFAVDEVLVEYYQGSYHFDYQQWPWGSYSGTFDAEGEILDPNVGWAEGQTESVGGHEEVLSDTLTVWGYGAVLNEDGTVDVAAVFIRSTDSELLPGTYPVDTNDYMTEFAFFDNVGDFEIPDQGGDIAAWLDTLDADQKFFGTSGSITVTQIDEEGFVGTFTGSMADPYDFKIITVDNAYFDMDGHTVTGASEAPALAVQGNFPNPFNPKTTLRFELSRPGALRVSIFDLSGRELRVLADGHFDAGPVELIWNGRDRRDRELPGGVYLYRIESAGAATGGKMVMVK